MRQVVHYPETSVPQGHRQRWRRCPVLAEGGPGVVPCAHHSPAALHDLGETPVGPLSRPGELPLQKVVSLERRDLQATVVDTFLQDWGALYGRLYAFPPPQLVPQVPAKVVQHKVSLILYPHKHEALRMVVWSVSGKDLEGQGPHPRWQSS